MGGTYSSSSAYTCYTHPKCGYCQKLKQEVRAQGLRHRFEFIDCSRGQCRNVRAFPQTCSKERCVVGYRNPHELLDMLKQPSTV